MKLKNNKGITLVALIITIMILIMLAAVTIITMIDSGIIKVASEGAENYQKAQYREQGEIQEAEGVVQNAIDKLKGNGGEDPDTPTPEEPKEIAITELAIGDYVNYDPVNEDYEVPAKTVNSSATATTVNADDELQWRVWSTDNGELRLISDRPTKNETGYKLSLYSYYGYNNGVYILNDICKTSYASRQTYKDMKIRNLNIEDIEEVTKHEYYEDYSPDGYKIYSSRNTISTKNSGFVPTGWNILDKGIGETAKTRSTQNSMLTRI